MQTITNIKSHPNQTMRIALEGGKSAVFRLYFLIRPQSWYFDLIFENTTINGVKVVLHPNILRQFKNILPFGIQFASNSNAEPFQLNDFSSGRVLINILTADEVAQIEQDIYGN